MIIIISTLVIIPPSHVVCLKTMLCPRFSLTSFLLLLSTFLCFMTLILVHLNTKTLEVQKAGMLIRNQHASGRGLSVPYAWYGDEYDGLDLSNCINKYIDMKQECNVVNTTRDHKTFLSFACEKIMQKNKVNKRKFVIALGYWEQLHMAMTNFFFLVRVARDWKARVVQPFTSDSKFYGIPYTHGAKKAAPIDFLYDRKSLNKLLCSYHLPPMGEFEDFLRNARRQLVLIHLVYPYNMAEIQPHVHQLKLKKMFHFYGPLVECNKFRSIVHKTKETLKVLNHEATQHKLLRFRFLRVLCLNASHPTSPEKIAKQLDTLCHSCNNASIILSNWKGVSNKLTEKGATGSHPPFRLLLPEITRSQIPYSTHDPIPQSSCVHTIARSFLRSKLSADQAFVVIHIRSEKIGQRDKRKPGFFEKCFNTTLRIRDIILHTNPNLDVTFFTDYGTFGSTSCHDCHGASLSEQTLAREGLRALHFDPTSHNVWCDSGFVAGVELNAMSQAEYLILLGGGSFQVPLYEKHCIIFAVL